MRRDRFGFIVFMVLCLKTSTGYCSRAADQTVPLLRKYCQACHAIGNLRFLVSESDDEVWDFLYSQSSPSGQIWAKEIVRVLDWPSNNPPAVTNGNALGVGRDWMPKGKKRYDIVSDKMEDGRDVRQFLRDSLRNHLPSYLQD